MENNRLSVLLYNAIVLLEETRSKEEVLTELGISEGEYEIIMYRYW